MSNLNPRVFNLAANLFGERPPAQPSVAKVLQKEIADRIFAVYPCINDEAFSLTMDNYRQHIAAYNFRISEVNAQIEKQNALVRENVKKGLTEVQKQFAALFYKKNANLSAKDFNPLAVAFNSDYGIVIEQRKIQTVKYATEIIFQNFLHLYAIQLMKRNTEYMRLRVVEPRPLQPFEVNSAFVTELKRNDVKSLNLCPKTVRNHRQRLEEAGVFIEYKFNGHKRPVDVQINPEILAVFDIKTNKLTIAENQRLNPRFGKMLPDNDEITRTSLNECQIKENASGSPDIRSSLPLTPFYLLSTGTPVGNVQKANLAAAEKTVKVAETLSEKLQELIIHPHELAVNLANKEYSNYRPIDIRYLYKEAFSGTLTNDEFRELALQDFFKTVSKIWKNSTAFPGSWKKAISLYYSEKWIAFTGNSMNKSAVVEDIQQMRWRIEWARKWFTKNKFPALFPAEYFDVTRKTSREVGFEYTKRKWTEHLEAAEKYKKLRKRQESDAIRRKETINHSKKCRSEVLRFLKNKITLSQLYDYVRNNLPPNYYEELPELISKENIRLYGNSDQSFDGHDFAKYSPLEF